MQILTKHQCLPKPLHQFCLKKLALSFLRQSYSNTSSCKFDVFVLNCILLRGVPVISSSPCRSLHILHFQEIAFKLPFQIMDHIPCRLVCVQAYITLVAQKRCLIEQNFKKKVKQRAELDISRLGSLPLTKLWSLRKPDTSGKSGFLGYRYVYEPDRYFTAYPLTEQRGDQ